MSGSELHVAAVNDITIVLADYSGSCSDPDCCGGPFEDLYVICRCGDPVAPIGDDQVTLVEVQEIWERHIKNVASPPAPEEWFQP